MVLVAAAFLAAALSCSRGAKVIPVRKMEKIYKEMFLADQWLSDNPSKRSKADTTWFYEPIFNKYGYDVEDYRRSVDFYLSDPKRYAEMLGKVSSELSEESERLYRVVAKKEKLRHVADSIALARKQYAPDDFVYFSDYFYVNSMTDRMEFRRNAKGVCYPHPVVEDTVFHGPELIIRDSLAETPEAERLVIPWKE